MYFRDGSPEEANARAGGTRLRAGPWTGPARRSASLIDRYIHKHMNKLLSLSLSLYIYIYIHGLGFDSTGRPCFC